VIELIDLSKTYGARRVLANAFLTVRRGEALALLGGNGSGKTTMLRCAVGLHHPDSGRVIVDGVDAVKDPHGARARMSYLPQRADFPATLTVTEILKVVARLRELPAAAVSRELALCNLERLGCRTISRLSGGERQRVALAILLMPTVNVYLLDEPTASLDPEGTALFFERVCALREKGAAILFTTHVQGDVAKLATREATLRNGRVEMADANEEGVEETFATAEDWRCGPRRVVVGGMRRCSWPGAAAAGSRELREVRDVDFQ
jgi:ABC-type multidrug transport system ATPase subunit